jgi:hypothetical protein
MRMQVGVRTSKTAKKSGRASGHWQGLDVVLCHLDCDNQGFRREGKASLTRFGRTWLMLTAPPGAIDVMAPHDAAASNLASCW